MTFAYSNRPSTKGTCRRARVPNCRALIAVCVALSCSTRLTPTPASVSQVPLSTPSEPIRSCYGQAAPYIWSVAAPSPCPEPQSSLDAVAVSGTQATDIDPASPASISSRILDASTARLTPQAAFLACYNDLAGRECVTGNIDLILRLNCRGEVESFKATTTMTRCKLVTCLLEAVKNSTFPPPLEGKTTVSFRIRGQCG
jgi:hypothetical protein